MAINITSNLEACAKINTLADCANTIFESQSNGASISVTLNIDSEIKDAFDSLGVAYSVNEVAASEPVVTDPEVENV